MDKAEIRAELDKLGVVYNSRLGEEKLMAILEDARAKANGSTGITGATGSTGGATGVSGPTGPTAPEAGLTGPTAPTAPAAPEPARTLVKIKDKHNFTVRTFSLEEHGPDFVELAQSFAQKKGLRIG